VGTLKRNRLVVVAAALVLAPSLVWGAGFALFEHGNRGMAMGGAMTAIADDPSALFWNPAGLALQADKGTQVQFGVTLISASQDFSGEGPYPGDGYFASQKDQVFFPPHFYLVYPVNDRIVLGFGMNTPFGLGTWWEDDFAGRYISKRVDIKRVDMNPTIGFKLTDRVTFGVGIIYAQGSIDLTPGLGVVNPFTQQLTDVGQVHLYAELSENDGWGWDAGLHFDLGKGFEAGILYRSQVDIDYEGYGSFTQFPTGYPEFDAAVGSIIPFGENVPVRTSISFPDFFSIGMAWTAEQFTVSAQYGWMGWATFKELPIEFVGHPELSGTVPELYKNVSQYRLGLEYRMDESWAFRGGLLYDDTPQPAESMSPLLGDGDRKGISVGIGWKYKSITIDVADMYLFFDSRSTHGRSIDGYEGRYETSANLFGVTFTYTF